MEKQICTKCDIEKEISEFFVRNKKTGKHHTVCKLCASEGRTYKKHYEKYKDKYIARAKKRNDETLKENQQHLLQYLSDKQCVDCSDNRPVVLQFDHRDPEQKEYQISRMLRSYKWETILKEIDKCDIVCANCHAIRTAKQFGWYKLLV